jgi:hypothetical protein
MGHTTPEADLMVLSPKLRQMFLVDVKGLYTKNPWWVKPKTPRNNLFYVLAYVPTSAPNKFFVMTQNEVNESVQTELTRLKRPNNYSFQGFTVAVPHEDAWTILPE